MPLRLIAAAIFSYAIDTFYAPLISLHAATRVIRVAGARNEIVTARARQERRE